MKKLDRELQLQITSWRCGIVLQSPGEKARAQTVCLTRWTFNLAVNPKYLCILQFQIGYFSFIIWPTPGCIRTCVCWYRPLGPLVIWLHMQSFNLTSKLHRLSPLINTGLLLVAGGTFREKHAEQ